MMQSRMGWGVVSKLLQDYKGVVQLIISVYHDYGRSACRFVIKQPDPSDCEPPMFSEDILSLTIIVKYEDSFREYNKLPVGVKRFLF